MLGNTHLFPCQGVRDVEEHDLLLKLCTGLKNCPTHALLPLSSPLPPWCRDGPLVGQGSGSVSMRCIWKSPSRVHVRLEHTEALEGGREGETAEERLDQCRQGEAPIFFFFFFP